MSTLVFQDWMITLPMQQQSVLVLACRGPDGVGKFHPTKEVVCRYRACVLKAAYLGRPMRIDEGDDTTFMTLIRFSDDNHWQAIVRKFFDYQDEIPHHYYMHLAHGAEIIGYKHHLTIMRERWLGFYHRCAENLHMTPETEAEMDARLADWHRQFWDQGVCGWENVPKRATSGLSACNALDKAHALLSSVMRYEAGGAIELPPLLAADIEAWIDGEYDPGERKLKPCEHRWKKAVLDDSIGCTLCGVTQHVGK